MAKTAIMSDIADKTGLTKKQVGEVFEALAALVASELKSKGVFKIPNLVQVKRVHQAARAARQGPKPGSPGETVMYKARPARHVVKVRALKALKDKV